MKNRRKSTASPDSRRSGWSFSPRSCPLSWNDLFYGLILAPGKAAILPVAIAGFNTFRGVQIGSMSAAILIAVVPVVIASFFIQRRLVQGISGGAVKF